MEILIFVTWFFMGLYGAFSIWLFCNSNVGVNYRPAPCPTPRDIVIILIGSCFGPVVAIIATFGWIIVSLEMIDNWLCEKDWFNKFSQWYNKPICKKKD